VCEGKITEDQYFSRLVTFFRAASVNVATCRIEGLGRDPYSVVQRAIVKRDRDQGRNGDPYNEVWCVVDVDDHNNLPEALDLAVRNEIKVAVSNPCFELWLYWHYADHAAFITTKQIQKKLKTLVRGYEKELPLNFPYCEYSEAKRRALAACLNATSPCVVEDNPASTAWLVVESIKNAGGHYSN
jgi:hypothetical protein